MAETETKWERLPPSEKVVFVALVQLVASEKSPCGADVLNQVKRDHSKNLQKSSVYRALRSLEKKGYITHHEGDDPRAKGYEPTPDGIDEYEAFITLGKTVLDELSVSERSNRPRKVVR